MPSLRSIPPYTVANWQSDRELEQAGGQLACPNCGHDEWFHPIGVPPEDGGRRKYRACKVCGFWQEADGTPAYRCYMTVHVCLGKLRDGERCDYCGAWGPVRWHPGCWRILPGKELGSTTCQSCGVVLTRSHVVPWPVVLEDPITDLSDAEIEELRKVLFRHLILLDAMLASPERWNLDLHIPMAVQLRVLLCDKELPVLSTYARARGIPLRVWGPRPAGSGLHTELLFSLTALVASWKPVGNGHEMSIEEYLETGVAVVPLEGEESGRAYSPKQIITWVSNKEGGAHFDFDKPATLEALKKSVWASGDTTVDAFEVKRIIFGVAEWTLAALVHCLDLEASQPRAPAESASP